MMNALQDITRRTYQLLVTGANSLRSPTLLALRLYFFWQLFLAGKGKLSNIEQVSEFFASLHIPMPALNVYFIGSLECFGSLLLIIGLGSRLLSLLIAISMTVAYLAADFEAAFTTLGPIWIDVSVKQRRQRPQIFGSKALPQALSLNRPLDQNRVDEHR